ncbi:hypothetical protein AC1031_006247 [Aphanomyces cochlioides]|nr:hypothetical protein AC1031_006247 [Aphanomyces cochlioides]
MQKTEYLAYLIYRIFNITVSITAFLLYADMFFTSAQRAALVSHLLAGCNSKKECAAWRYSIAVELDVDPVRIDRWFGNNRHLAVNNTTVDNDHTTEEARSLPNTTSLSNKTNVAVMNESSDLSGVATTPSRASKRQLDQDSSTELNDELQTIKKLKGVHDLQQHGARADVADGKVDIKLEQEQQPTDRPRRASTNVNKSTQRSQLPADEKASAENKISAHSKHPQVICTTNTISRLLNNGEDVDELAASHADANYGRGQDCLQLHPLVDVGTPRRHTKSSNSLSGMPTTDDRERSPTLHRRAASSRKKGKETKVDDTPVDDEKRLSRYRSTPNQQTRDRIERAKHQRMFMIEKQVLSPLHQTFAVMGSTGNIYTVSIEQVPTCTCPDFLRGNLCKHILFVYLKCLRVNASSPLVFQKALLTSELRAIFESASRVDPRVVANQQVIAHYKAAMKGESLEQEEVSVEQKSLEGTDCPICFEDLADGRPVVWCKAQCGNNIHNECFNQWKKSKLQSGGQLTCVYCRSPWGDGSSSKDQSHDERYLNLASVANLPRERDTSSYRRWHWRSDY